MNFHRGRSRAPLAALCAMLLSSTAAPALAQDQTPAGDAATDVTADEGQAIVVTGQRAAERRAVDKKRAADTIQDSVAANDVGKLPDQNVAEAVRRIPGVSVANDQGEGRYVVIRGVDPNLANVTINGQAAPAPEPEGRQVKLDDIPSSLIGSVDVVKSLTADRDANAIAGQVDINTLSAFDRKGFFAQARGAYGEYDLNKKHPYEGDATVGGRVGDFGIVASGNYSRRPIASENTQGSANWRVINGNLVPDDFRIRSYNLTRTRYGGVLNLDWRPSDDIKLFARTLYSVFKDNETRDQTRIEIPAAITGQTATTGTFNGRGTVFVRRRIEDDNTFTGEFGGHIGLGGPAIDFAATYSRAIKTDPLRSEFSFRTPNNAITGNVYDTSEFLFIVNRGTQAFVPATYQGFRVNYDKRRAEENLYQGRVDLTVPLDSLGDGSSIKVGGKYIQRDKTNNRDFQQYNLATSTNLDSSGAAITSPLSTYDGRYLFGPRINYDLAQAYYTATNPGARTLDAAGSLGNSLVNDYEVNEKVYAGYAMAVVKVDRLTVIPGVRVEHTKDDVSGKNFTTASTATQGFNIFAGNSYTDWFPGLNVRFDATDRFVVRGGATTSIGRPNYSQLAPYVQIDTGANTVNQGNPNLKPLKAKNLDLSLEYYLPGHGVLSVAGFYKHIDDPIFSAFTLMSGTFGGIAFTNAGVTQPVNADAAEIFGVEFNVQAPLSFLPSPLDGFGVNLNYTRTGGQSYGVPGHAGAADNFLQSQNVASAQLYFEKGPFAARIAWSYRSKYLDTVGSDVMHDQYTADHEQYDARISFAVIPQVVLFAEGSNLSDSPWRRWVGKPSQMIENERYGAAYRGGVQLAF